jgi:hypothetical protein
LADEDDEHECGRCGAIISYGRAVTVEYNSSPKSPPDIVEAKWVNSQRQGNAQNSSIDGGKQTTSTANEAV